MKLLSQIAKHAYDGDRMALEEAIDSAIINQWRSMGYLIPTKKPVTHYIQELIDPDCQIDKDGRNI
jgi:hypothetical protein